MRINTINTCFTHVIISSFISTQQNMSILPSMTFHTGSVGTAKLTRQIRTEKCLLIQINKRPLLFVVKYVTQLILRCTTEKTNHTRRMQMVILLLNTLTNVILRNLKVKMYLYQMPVIKKIETAFFNFPGIQEHIGMLFTTHMYMNVGYQVSIISVI